MAPTDFLEDPRIIDRLKSERKVLRSRGVMVDVAALSNAISLGVMETLYAVSFHKAWDVLGLDKKWRVQRSSHGVPLERTGALLD
jgi:hypothetical protein